MLKETLVSFISWKWEISEEKVLEYKDNIFELALSLFDNEGIPGLGLGLCEADLEYIMLILELEEFFAIEIDDEEVNNIFDVIENKTPIFEEKTEFDNIHDCWEYCYRVGRIYLIDMSQYKFGDNIEEYIKERKMSPMKFNDFILNEALTININNPKLKRVSPTKIQFEENNTVFSAEIRDTFKENTFKYASIEFYEGDTCNGFDITNKHKTGVFQIYSLAWSAMLTLVDEYMPIRLTISTQDEKINIFDTHIKELLRKNEILKKYNLTVTPKPGNSWILTRKI